MRNGKALDQMMIRFIFILFLGLIGCASRSGEAPGDKNGPQYAEWPSIDGEKIFDPLSSADATKKGRQLARKDFDAGYYRILYYGYSTGVVSKAEKRLFHKFGVRGYSVAGCMVTEGLIAGANSYNATMQYLLNQKFGRDIFRESGFSN